MSTTDEADINLNYQSQSSPLSRHKISTRIQKQISKSLDRGGAELESMLAGGRAGLGVGDEEYDELAEDCEIDLLSSSADYAIHTVGENMNMKRH